MKINVKQTNMIPMAMQIGMSTIIRGKGQQLEQVRQFRCLGSLQTEDGRSEKVQVVMVRVVK